MVKLKNKIQILFFVSLMFLLAQALEINLLNFLTDFKCKINIKVNTNADGSKVYAKLSLRPMYYWTSNGTSTVIVYIVDESRFEEIAISNAFNVRMGIAYELGQNNHEMIILGIKNCQPDEFDLISQLIFDIIKPHPSQMSLRIVTMGEQSFSRTYLHDEIPVEKYQENRNIHRGGLQRYLNKAFPTMKYRSKRSDPSNIREVLFHENLEYGCPGYSEEIRWTISVENGEYIPAHPFVPYLNRKMYKEINRIHLLILSGKDYNRLTSNNLPWFEELKKIMNEMSRNNEKLFMMGFFNFDWSEIDIVPQIIMKHSQKVRAKNAYNVFTIGIGMFNTLFQNPNKDDKRLLSSTQNERVIDFVKKYNEGTMKERTIEICNFDALDVTPFQIRLVNGRYVPLKEFKNYCFSSKRPNAKFAFIVMDSTEMYNENVYSVAEINQSVGMLKNNGIVVFVIKTINFELYDLHIIPEWIQWHRGAVHPDRIAILGGGSFDTTFKYVSPQYEVTYTLLNMAKELKAIRMAFVHTADDKGVIVGNIDTANFTYWRFPMHTINGFYDPVVLSTSEMFSTEGGIKILFLIMKADKFNHMAKAYPNYAPILRMDLREKIAGHYPFHQWTVYLVGLDNFGKKDFHLFAEFVKIHSYDIRPFWEFVYTFGDDICQAEYEYRDTLPFTTANNMPMAEAFTEFFNMTDIFSNLELFQV